jgi:hypothetical protein
MCLIIHGPSALIRSTLLDTPSLLAEIFTANGDGLGIMFNASGGVRVRKWLPQSLKQAVKAVESFPNDDRELAVHWRWRTHGDIDLANCHPYPVDGGHFMHNGVLETGNAADKTKSDTWHYAKNFLAGGVMAAMAHEPPFLALISDHIGAGNKFVMMTEDGRMSIAGRHRGIDVSGLWFSNTYAWDPVTLDPTWVDPSNKYKWQSYLPSKAMHGSADLHEYEVDAEDWQDLLTTADVEAIVEVLEDVPYVDLRFLFAQEWKVKPYRDSTAHPDIMAMILAGDATKLAEQCNAGRATTVAEVLAYYTEWDFGFIDEGEDEDPFQTTSDDSQPPISYTTADDSNSDNWMHNIQRRYNSFNESYAG